MTKRMLDCVFGFSCYMVSRMLAETSKQPQQIPNTFIDVEIEHNFLVLFDNHFLIAWRLDQI